MLSSCKAQTTPASDGASEVVTLSPEILGTVIYTDPTQALEARVEDLLKHMSLEGKIGQMTQVEKNSIAPGDITKYYIGSIFSAGGGSPGTNTTEGSYAMVKPVP